MAIAGVAVAWAVVLLLLRHLVGLAERYPTDLPPHPYFLPGQAVGLWLLTPAAVVALVVVLVAPGTLLVLALGGADSAAGLAIRGFGASYLVRGLVHAALVSAGVRESAGVFIGTEFVLDGLAAMLLLYRAGRVGGLLDVFGSAVDRGRLLRGLALTAVLTAALVPLIFWQDITADGLEALASGLSLGDHALPRFPNSASLMGLGIGMSAMAYPTHWFASLLGPLEAAARLPALLYAPLLFLALAGLVEVRSPRRMRPFEELALLAVVAAFVVTLGYNGSYEPYAADLSAPAAFESLTVLAMTSAMLFLWRGQTPWFVGFTLLTYFARPTGFLFLLLMALGSVALDRRERGLWLRRIGIGVVACVGLWILFEKVFIGIAGHGRASYLSESILFRLQYLRFLDLRRFLFVLVPGGVLPVLALFAVRRQDRLARALALFCLLYFGFFYFQAFVALHHFAPLMVLPAVVFWRVVLHGPGRRWHAPVALAGALLAIVLAVPPHYEVYRAPRRIGQETAFEVGNTIGTYAQYREARTRSFILTSLFPSEVEGRDPADHFVIAPDVLAYYSDRFTPSIDDANYVAQYASAPAPPGFIKVAERERLVAFVRDTARWREDQHDAPTTDFRSPLYALSRTTMHRYLGVPAGEYDFNLATLPFVWRFFQPRSP